MYVCTCTCVCTCVHVTNGYLSVGDAEPLPTLAAGDHLPVPLPLPLPPGGAVQLEALVLPPQLLHAHHQLLDLVVQLRVLLLQRLPLLLLTQHSSSGSTYLVDWGLILSISVGWELIFKHFSRLGVGWGLILSILVGWGLILSS